MNIAIIGPNCAGKTTCAKKIAKKFGLLRFSLGQMIKDSIRNHTFLGLITLPYAQRGNFVLDEIANATLEDFIYSNSNTPGFVFDNFPCTLYQAIFMIDLLKKKGKNLDGVVFMNLPANLSYGRALARTSTDEQIEKTTESITDRINNYRNSAESVLRLFAHSIPFLVVDAQQSEEVVDAKVDKFIKSLKNKNYTSSSSEILDKEIDLFLASYKINQNIPESHPLNLIIMGPPGCGKGTHSAFLSEYLSIPTISTGNLFRDHLKGKTPLGTLAGAFMNQGKLVPDDVTAAMVKNRLNDNDAMHGFILDGFPRTVPQANSLDNILATSSRSLDGVIYLNVPDEEIIVRTSGRRFCPHCQRTYHIVYNKPQKDGYCDADGEALIIRADDKEETVRERLMAYRKQTLPVIEHYRQRNLLREISGNDEVAIVRERMTNCCKELVLSKLASNNK